MTTPMTTAAAPPVLFTAAEAHNLGDLADIELIERAEPDTPNTMAALNLTERQHRALIGAAYLHHGGADTAAALTERQHTAHPAGILTWWPRVHIAGVGDHVIDLDVFGWSDALRGVDDVTAYPWGDGGYRLSVADPALIGRASAALLSLLPGHLTAATHVVHRPAQGGRTAAYVWPHVHVHPDTAEES